MKDRELWKCPCCGKGWMVEPDMILHCPICGTIYHGMTIKDFKKAAE